MFKLTATNRDDSIPLKEYELEKAIRGRSEMKPTIFEQGIVLNWNMYGGIIADERVKETVKEYMRIGKTIDEARKEAENDVSPFARLLASKFKMLGDKQRTEAQEESASDERKRT